MLDPYRIPGPVDADPSPEPLPVRCVPPAAPGCSRCLAAPTPRTAIPPGFAKALSAAATLLLLVGSASLSAVTWTVTSSLASAVRGPRGAEGVPQTVSLTLPAIEQPGTRARAHRPPAPRPPAPRARPADPGPVGMGAWQPSLLASLGKPTHDPLTLWKRAETFAADTGAMTLVRVTVAPDVLFQAVTPARSAHGIGGFRVKDVGLRSVAPLFGLQRGDRITAVNGHLVDRPEGMLGAYADVRTTKLAVVELVRAGKLVTMRVEAAR